jgi:hypothetical protein
VGTVCANGSFFILLVDGRLVFLRTRRIPIVIDVITFCRVGRTAIVVGVVLLAPFTEIVVLVVLGLGVTRIIIVEGPIEAIATVTTEVRVSS